MGSGTAFAERAPTVEEGSAMDATRVKLKVVWAVSDGDGRPRRTRVGVAWQNDDGSLSARLDAFPVSGRLRVVDWTPTATEADPETSP
jgi:hypothetical protein